MLSLDQIRNAIIPLRRSILQSSTSVRSKFYIKSKQESWINFKTARQHSRNILHLANKRYIIHMQIKQGSLYEQAERKLSNFDPLT